MNKKAILTILLFFVGIVTYGKDTYFTTQNPTEEPLHEIRAVWYTTLKGLDWPRTESIDSVSMLRQQQNLINDLDKLQRAGINTVMFQARIRGTRAYESDTEVWETVFSGDAHTSPGYDPLAFAVEQCHLRGMRIHAWVVTIPLGNKHREGAVEMLKTNPSLVKTFGDAAILNPEAEGTADYLADICRDIARRYDVDGIHLDFIRYPDQWRNFRNKQRARDNITRIVEAISKAVRAEKHWLQLSCAPVGKYANTMRQSAGGWNARDAVAQDAVKWLDDGLMDVLYPMLYFRYKNFYPFAIDWLERSNGRPIVVGLGIYFLHPSEGRWRLSDVTREMFTTRQYGMGTAMFRSKFLTDNTKGLYDFTRDVFSRRPALQPAMTWLSDCRPMPPRDVYFRQTDSTYVLLHWTAPADDKRSEGGVKYNIYGSDSYPVNTQEADNLLATEFEGTFIDVPLGRTVRFLAITTTDRYGNESTAVQATAEPKDEAVEVFKPADLYEYCDGRIDLTSADVEDGQVIEVVSLTGCTLRTSLVHRVGDGMTAEVGVMSPGHYRLYVITRKDKHHMVGHISVPL